MTRLLLPGALLLASLGGLRGEEGRPRPSPRAQEGLRRAAGFLWSRQAADGGWHSETYGLLRSGQALTPFILLVLLDVPEEVLPRPAERVERALGFLRRGLDRDGALGLSDRDLLEYPLYATAHGLSCFLRAGGPADEERVARMTAWLVAKQYREEDGFGPDHPAHGGWGFGGVHPRGVPGHMDLAHTRRALEALRGAVSSGLRADGTAFERAQAFLRRVQEDPGGGFSFSPIVLDANKGGFGPGGAPLSYSTATCDGVLALLAAGVARSDERVARARRWIEGHPRLDRPEGIPAGGTIDWGEEVFFYHLAVRAEACRALGIGGDWRARTADTVLLRQGREGGFGSSHHLMKEDDPLLATALAARALASALLDSPAARS
jgi:hypothetical protein